MIAIDDAMAAFDDWEMQRDEIEDGADDLEHASSDLGNGMILVTEWDFAGKCTQKELDGWNLAPECCGCLLLDMRSSQKGVPIAAVEDGEHLVMELARLGELPGMPPTVQLDSLNEVCRILTDGRLPSWYDVAVVADWVGGYLNASILHPELQASPRRGTSSIIYLGSTYRGRMRLRGQECDGGDGKVWDSEEDFIADVVRPAIASAYFRGYAEWLGSVRRGEWLPRTSFFRE